VSASRPKRHRHFPDVSDAPERREQVIATGRVFLAACAMLSLYVGPIRPIQNSTIIATLLSGYLVLSIVLWLVLRRKPTAEPSVQISAHVADLFCTTALTVFSRGPDSPFFLFFVFVLLAAAYRWGFRGTTLTAGGGIALLCIEAYELVPASLPARVLGGAGFRMAPPFQYNILMLRCAYLLMVGLILGYLAEGEKALQSEAAATAQIMGKAQVGGGLKATIQGILDQILSTFGVSRAMVIVEEIESGRMFVWEAARPARNGPTGLELREVQRSQQAAYRSPDETRGWLAWKTRQGGYRLAALPSDEPESRSEQESPTLPSVLLGCGSALAAPFRLGHEWQGWVYLLELRRQINWRKELRLLRRVIDAAAPAVYNAFLLSRMRSQIGAQERGRVARELHDGAIQSLLGAELQMHVLRKRSSDAAAPAGPLNEVQALIHDQVINLRELMEKIRPIDPDPRHLREFLSEQVEKFQRETGIEAEFSAEGAPVRLTGRACRELIRIVQELLFNVRRHSGAERVEVRLKSYNGTCKLQVADNGRGFDFAGRLDLPALQAMRKGPRVVQERVRTLGGLLEIESQPGTGARIEITLPQREE
jgi:signal transduction histidine kinase